VDYAPTCPTCKRTNCIDQRETIMRAVLDVSRDYGINVGDDYDRDSTLIEYSCWECGAEPTEDEIAEASIPSILDEDEED
jgi:hypothetical protein